MGLIQLIRDFRKWRKERYRRAIMEALNALAVTGEDALDIKYANQKDLAYWKMGVRYGIEHRNEILKKVNV